MTLSHALSMTPAIMKKALTVMQDAYPRRPKALHFINMPSVMESVFKMAQGFQKEKMRARNHVHPVGDYRYFCQALCPVSIFVSVCPKV